MLRTKITLDQHMTMSNNVATALTRCCGSLSDGFVGEQGLLADMVWDFGQVTFVGRHRWEVLGLADEVECAQGFPGLVDCWIDGGDFRSRGDRLPGLCEKISDST